MAETWLAIVSDIRWAFLIAWMVTGLSSYFTGRLVVSRCMIGGQIWGPWRDRVWCAFMAIFGPVNLAVTIALLCFWRVRCDER